jgi:hypothetical protein
MFLAGMIGRRGRTDHDGPDQAGGSAETKKARQEGEPVDAVGWLSDADFKRAAGQIDYARDGCRAAVKTVSPRVVLDRVEVTPEVVSCCLH